jgi:hypothetical protein
MVLRHIHDQVITTLLFVQKVDKKLSLTSGMLSKTHDVELVQILEGLKSSTQATTRSPRTLHQQ